MCTLLQPMDRELRDSGQLVDERLLVDRHRHRRRHLRHRRPTRLGLFGRFGLPATND